MTRGHTSSASDSEAGRVLGLMQDEQLTIDKIIEHARKWHGRREIVSRSVEGPILRTTYGELYDRSARLSVALQAFGVSAGDRIATLAWNTARHLEAWYAIMGIGAVCHTLNPRLFAEQIAWIVNDASDRIIIADAPFAAMLDALLPLCPSVELVILLTDPEAMPAFSSGRAFSSERLIETATGAPGWGGFDEQTAAGLCYTSGTTGNPKGVLYSHRSNYLHTLITLQADIFGLRATDVVMPIVPMFHANAWGLAFSGPAVGAKMVMPGDKLDGASIHALLESEGVTFSAGVPTVWQTLLQYMRETRSRLTSLQRVLIGGSAVPETLVRAFEDEFAVRVIHAWGMTEASPLGSTSAPLPETQMLPKDQREAIALKQGRPPIGVDMKLVDEAGNLQPHDGQAAGRLMIKGPYIVREYYGRADETILDDQGYFDTGDVATIDVHGFMEITDRAKDVVKSGGEWISSIALENIAISHPKAALAAVIGIPHPKWDERPLLLVKLNNGESATKDEFLSLFEGKVAKWWIPDDVCFVDDIPLGATGKIDKKSIRYKFLNIDCKTSQRSTP